MTYWKASLSHPPEISREHVLVRAQDLKEAMARLGQEFPDHAVVSIEESVYTDSI